VSEPPTAPPETILFVEDETLVRMDMAEFLRECGYRVYEAATAKEAIEALQAKFVVDLVFTDINLPDDMNGLELGEWTLRERPGVKVLVTTGDASRTDIPQTVGLVLAKAIHGPRFASPGTTGADEAIGRRRRGTADWMKFAR
jgi:CheY-like chemotaxis protein